MGERFGNYELLEKIAVGGMAEIFLARASHGRGVTRQIVIKRIHPALSADKNFVGMFIDEARLGVTMMHGNIVPVFDFGCVDGYYYLAMEYVDGQDLSSLMGRARVVGIHWPEEYAALIVMEVLEGLDYAHRKRDDQGRPIELVHRDVSPSNILVSRDGQVKLLDFGIARSLASEYETRTGIIKGKPGYMSPEQARGAVVDARADIWSCGAVLHELLTGKKVKDGREPINDKPLDSVLEKALATDPAHRYSTARDFQESLSRILVDRGLRPTSRDLASIYTRIIQASAPSEDWNIHTSGTVIEKHLAKALSAMTAGGNTAPHTAPESPHEPSEQTLEMMGRGRRVVPWLALAAAVAVVVAVPWIWRSPNALPKEPGKQTLHRVLSEAGHRAREMFPSPVLFAQLPPMRTSLVVVGNPAEASIEVDGVKIGHGRVELQDLSLGSHVIAVKSPGYIFEEREVRIESGQRQTLTISLERRAPKAVASSPSPLPGNLSINTSPWSNVVIDGQSMGNTPIIDLEVSPGRHTIVLNNPVRNLSRTVIVDIKPGESKRIREVLDGPTPQF
jgi:serine/threonine-protein kinase